MIKKLKHTSLFHFMLPCLGVIACICIWEANCHFRLYNIVAPSLQPSAFPSSFQILRHLFDLAYSQVFWEAFGTTAFRTLCAFFIATFVGIILGLVAGKVRLIDSLMNVPVEFFRNLPAIAIMPIIMLFLGIGGAMKITLCVFGAVFPIFIATRLGIQNIKEEIHIAARFYGWCGWRLIFFVLFPSALPEIVVSSQTALAISLILAVTGEMLVGNDGLGGQIIEAERTFNNLDLYALVLALGILGSILCVAFRFMMTRIIYWKLKINWHEA